MHPNSARFCVAVADPFSPAAKGAKLPAGSPAATLPQGAKLSFDGTIGNDGTACAFINPSPFNDCPSIWFSNSSTLGSFDSFDNFTSQYNTYGTNPSSVLTQQGLATQTFSGLPYASSAVVSIPTTLYGLSQTTGFAPPNVRARVVLMSLEISFSGSTLNDGGVEYALVDPVHDNMVGQGQGYVSNFTSMTWQRLAKRSKLVLTVLPVTRDQQELSNSFDDCAITYNPVNNALTPGVYAVVSGGGLMSTGALTMPITSGSPTLGPMLGIRDQVSEMRNQICLHWPLSRKNALVIQQPEIDTSNAVVVRTCTSNGVGLVTWTVNPPATPPSGQRVAVQAYGVSNNLLPTVYFYWTGSQWYVFNELGGSVTISAATTFRFNAYFAYPPAIAGVLINAGSGTAGQTFHMEATIHVEYSGLAVQGRTTVTVPDQSVVDVMQAANLHARESCSNEVQHTVEHIASSAAKIASAHMPGLAASVCSALGCPEFAPGAAMLGSMLMKRPRR